jgi:hypothetical protein
MPHADGLFFILEARHDDDLYSKRAMLESVIESKGDYVPKYVSHKKPFVNAKTWRTAG